MEGNDGCFVFGWTLENFAFQPTGRCVYSPVFSADVPNMSFWRLKLSRNGEFVTCFLECHKCTKFNRMSMDFDVRLLDARGVARVSRELRGVVFTPGVCAGFEDFVRAVDLKRGASELLPGGHLTVECRLKQSDKPHDCDIDLAQLSRVFLGLFRMPEFSDFLLMTRRQNFRVHRELVCARAHRFSREHGLNGPRRATKRSLDWDDEVLLAFLIYLYSARIESRSPEVWGRLYDLTEHYAMHDLRRDMVPSPTASSAVTRVVVPHAKTVVFPVANFASTTSTSLGRLLDLGVARVGLEYLVHDDHALDPQVGIRIFSFGATADMIFCTVSVLDVESGTPHFTTRHEMALQDVTDLIIIPKRQLLAHQFVLNDTIRISITFQAPTSADPTKIRSTKTRKALCIGLTPPSDAALHTLSHDLTKLAMESSFLNHDSTTMGKDFSKMQKAVFSAWSGVFLESFRSKRPLKGMTPEICQVLYRYMCSGDIPGTMTQSALYLYPVSRIYAIPSLKQLLVRKIKSQLDKSNAADGLVFAHAFNIEELMVFVKDFVMRNHNEVVGEDSWKHLCDVNPDLAETVLENVMDHSSDLLR